MTTSWRQTLTALRASTICLVPVLLALVLMDHGQALAARVCGCVAGEPGGNCSQVDVTITLNPIGFTTTPPILGFGFCFDEDVPPGDYTLNVTPHCFRAVGCWPRATPVTVGDSDVAVSIPMYSCCVGSCGVFPAVHVNDLITCVSIALGNELSGDCLACDPNEDGSVTVDEILFAVTNALQGCPENCQAAA